jgi:hypothetical protein
VNAEAAATDDADDFLKTSLDSIVCLQGAARLIITDFEREDDGVEQGAIGRVKWAVHKNLPSRGFGVPAHASKEADQAFTTRTPGTGGSLLSALRKSAILIFPL